MIHHRPHCPRRGFTLLELLVVGTIGTLVIIFITNAWLWYARSTSAMHIAAQLNRELKLAAQAIAQDFGPALVARTTLGDNLQFDFDNNSDLTPQWASPDSVVEYLISGDTLLRRDLNSGVEVPLARGISALEAETSGGHLNIRLTATYRTTTQDLTLQLRDPS